MFKRLIYVLSLLYKIPLMPLILLWGGPYYIITGKDPMESLCKLLERWY